MGSPVLRTLFGTVELRPAKARPGSPSGTKVYTLLPELDELLRVPGFGLCNPIRVTQNGGRTPSTRRDSAINLH